MKSYLKLLLVACAASFLTIATHAADSAASTKSASSSPTGTWTWSQTGRDGTAWEQTLKLDYADGTLKGTVLGSQRGDRQIPDIALSDASFQDGVVAFSIKREFNGNSIVVKYQGKLDGDTIKGTTERTGRDGGGQQTREWVATRAK